MSKVNVGPVVHRVYTFAETRGFVEFWLAPYCFFTPYNAFGLRYPLCAPDDQMRCVG